VNVIARAVAEGKTKIAYIAPTYQQARDIAWEMLKKVFIGAEFNESRLEIRISDRTVYLRGWEAVETLRGQKFDLLVIDEIAMMRNFWVNWQEIIRPTLTDTQGKVLFISTPKGFNHFYDLYNLQDKDSDYKSFHFTSYDNPYLPVEELDKAKEELPEDRFAQEYLADFRKTEGLVYKEFNREKHVTSETPKNIIDTILGIDFGYTNPAAIIPIGIDGDSHYWIGEEWYKSRQTTEQIAEQALLYRSTKCYPDPAEPDRIQILSKSGLNTREVSKDIVAGIDHIRELFKQGRIHIHPDCKNLIMELETYRYPDKKPDKNEQEKPVKENDHALDALRYALYTNKPELPEQHDYIFETRGTYFED
jgi:PBSX family phage terminase large subunit